MRAAWRLAINSLSRRLSRTGLLIGSVALCAALISAIACAVASLNLAVDDRIRATVGAADLRVTHVGADAFDGAVLAAADAWPETALAVGRLRESLPLRHAAAGTSAVAIGYGVDPAREFRLRPLKLAGGRLPQAQGEIVLEQRLADALQATVGSVLDVERWGDPVALTVVGVALPSPLGEIFEQTPAYLTLEQVRELAGRGPRLSELDIVLREGSDPEAVAARERAGLAKGLLLQPTERITSGLENNAQASQVGFVLASLLAFLAAAFIIMTGLTTNVTERTRELAVLRSVGAFRGQLAVSQLMVGFVVGGLGAVAGVPLGIAGAWGLVSLFADQLPSGFAVSWLGVFLGLTGSTMAGMLGAAWPAVAAARVSPLEGLGVRARPARRRWVWVALGVGAAGVLTQIAILVLRGDPDFFFWTYVSLGVPAVFTGYFLLGVPVTAAANIVLSPLLGRLLGLPHALLRRTVAATPFRHGFTAASMMIGLALMTSIWMNGRSVMSDWLESLRIPDGFVYGLNMRPETLDRIRATPGVALTSAITVQTVEAKLGAGPAARSALGIRGLTSYKTSFIAFEPDAFFAMTSLTWIQGDPATAVARLKQGDAILVAREFLVTRGIGVGSKVDLEFQGRTHPFEVVGVVTSPGLDIVSKFYDIGENYVDQAVNSVFGTRETLVRQFGNDAINLVQIGFAPGADPEATLAAVRSIPRSGILGSGTATGIKREISEFISGSLFVFSTVAVGAMLVACFGVANLIVAGIQARQFEFGVLRAVGAQRWLIGRLVLGEAVVIGVAACVLGTGLGIQGGWGGQSLTEASIGLQLSVKPPLAPIAAGWAVVMAITLLAAGPAIARLVAKRPRELLAATKG